MNPVINAKNLILNANTILVTTHLFPDADGIGSQVALTLALKELGKKVFCVNEEKLSDRYKYMDINNVVQSYHQFKHEAEQLNEIDLLIVVDTNSPTRIGNHLQKLLEKSKKLLFIDHHPAPKAVSLIHCIDTKAAATGELVVKLLESFNLKFSSEISLPLYTAILIDTNSFRYKSVTAQTHLAVSKLMNNGLNSQVAYNQIYGTKKIGHIKLLGQVLSSIQMNKTCEIAWIVLKEQQIKKFDSDIEDTHAFINHLLILEKIKVAVMFREIKNTVKVSMRSVGNIDVGALAQALGGGGHEHSAATLIEGKSKVVVESVISQLEFLLKALKN